MADTVPRQRSGQHAGAERPAVVLQPPPSDREKYAYINRNLPYLFISLTIGFLSVTISQVFMEEHIGAALALVGFTALYAIYQMLSLPMNFTGRKFDVLAHRARIKAWRPRSYPTVDVYLPICGEPLEVLRNTWTGVTSVMRHYPGVVRAVVLDDGADPAAQTLAD